MALLLPALPVAAQIPNPASCDNIDFSRGNFTGWIGRTTLYKPGSFDSNNCDQASRVTTSCPDGTGLSCNGCYSLPGLQIPMPGACTNCINPPMTKPGDYYDLPGIVPGRHTIISASVPDPYTCNNVLTLPPGDNFAARLGNGGRGAWGSGVGWEIDYLSYSFTVGTDNTLLIYKYAVVLQDPLRDPNNPPHTDSIRPRFNVFIRDQAGSLIDPNCGKFEVVYDTLITGFRDCPYNSVIASGGNPYATVGTGYRAWTTVGVDLRAFAGQQVTLEFNTWDCGWGGHFGYAYVTARCDSLGILVGNCSPDGAVMLTAPDGFAYEWFNGESTRIILVDTVNSGDSVWVTLTSRNGCKTDLYARIYPTITNAVFDAQPSPICVNDTVFFTDDSYSIFMGTGDTVDITSWTWYFGDGGTSSQSSPYHIYTTPGNFRVRLDVSSAEGCIDSAFADIVVVPPPVPDFVFNNVCLGQPVFFTDNSSVTGSTIVSWLWDFGDGKPTLASQNPTHLYSSPGTYTVRLDINSSVGCPATISKTVTVLPKPTAVISGYDVCLGDTIFFRNFSVPGDPGDGIVNWVWSFGDSTSLQKATDPAHIYQNTGTFTVSLTVTTAAGCVADTSITVTVYPPPVAAFTTGPVCIGSPTTFNDLSTSTGSLATCFWDFGDGSTSSVCGDVSHTYTAPGVYVVYHRVAEASGCADSVAQVVTVNPKPLVCFTDSMRGCVPLVVPFNDCSTYGGQCLWDLGDGTTTTDCRPIHTYTESGCYDISLKVTSPEGCMDSLFKKCYVEGYPWPKADFDASPTTVSILFPIISFTDKSSGPVKWTWFFGDGGTSFIQHPNHTYRDTGIYMVTLIMENQYGCTDTIYKPVKVTGVSSIYVPNAFTPNRDGINDRFAVSHEAFCEIEMYIFDRWGNEIFRTNNFRGWDGTANSGERAVQEDVYVWLISAVDCYGNRWRRVGQVTVVK